MFTGLTTNVIKTNRLILRPLKEYDAQEIYNIRSDAYNLRFVSMKPYEDINRAKSFINSATDAVEKGILCFWGICRQDSDNVIGTICLWNFSEDGLNAEIGYELVSEYQGKGLMSEAVKAVIKYAFNHLNIKKIEAVTNKDNIASIYLLSGYKFEYIGKLEELVQDTDEENMIVYRLCNKNKPHTEQP